MPLFILAGPRVCGIYSKHIRGERILFEIPFWNPRSVKWQALLFAIQSKKQHHSSGLVFVTKEYAHRSECGLYDKFQVYSRTRTVSLSALIDKLNPQPSSRGSMDEEDKSAFDWEEIYKTHASTQPGINALHKTSVKCRSISLSVISIPKVRLQNDLDTTRHEAGLV